MQPRPPSPRDARGITLAVRACAGGAEQALLSYGTAERRFSVDRGRSSLDPDVRKGVHGGTVELDGGRLRWRVLLDPSTPRCRSHQPGLPHPGSLRRPAPDHRRRCRPRPGAGRLADERRLRHTRRPRPRCWPRRPAAASSSTVVSSSTCPRTSASGSMRRK
ncbi:GH32 C-terminal domain-containing protein [Streptomyces azureus]|uniref:GH32 C-terminal domain-containing protein n=1 Tax=Streptomyces azureus TaxID=146537 RepID=UPI00143172DB